jgi:hypothetical protein
MASCSFEIVFDDEDYAVVELEKGFGRETFSYSLYFLSAF